MASKLSLLSLAQIEAENGSSWTWNPTNPRNPSQRDEEDDSNWEVQAFAEDYTGSTWPPKSYSCSFCKREFRSAQALGGHMNVHRRDRASRRIHRPIPPRPAATTAAISGRVIPADQELILGGGNGGMCHFYQLPCRNRDYRMNGVFVASENSTKNVKFYSGEEDIDLELRLGTGR